MKGEHNIHLSGLQLMSVQQGQAVSTHALIVCVRCISLSCDRSQGHSCARQMPSSGAVELADVKRDWWCTSFPAALWDIFGYIEVSRCFQSHLQKGHAKKGKGLSAFASTLDPKVESLPRLQIQRL